MLIQSKNTASSSVSAGIFLYGTRGYGSSGTYSSNYYGNIDWSNISQISWYGSNANAQFNESNTTYSYILFSTNKIPSFETAFTANTTYIVPVTRNYLLELYGVGGGSCGSGYQGGSSCQRYDSI